MKIKNLILTALISFLIFGYSEVKAAPIKGGATDSCTATLHLNKLANTSNINANGIDHNNHSYYLSTVDGYQSMCMQAGKRANSDTVYSRGEAITGFAAQAYQYAASNNGEQAYLIGQTALWSHLNGNNPETIISGIADVYRKYHDDSGITYNSLAALEQARITYSQITSTPLGGTYYMWYSEYAGDQAMVSGLTSCDEPQKSACPGGKMVTTGGIGACSSKKVGGTTYTYQYLATAGNNSTVHKKYGESTSSKAGVGAYCRLFCQEQAQVTLPGGLDEAIQLGSYIVWPTSQTNNTNRFYANLYPLKFKGVKSCKLVLMPDNGNFPGVNGECEIDPVKEYNELYADMLRTGRTGDYSGVSFENVRIYNRNYFNEPEVCGTYKTPSETLSSGAVKYSVPATVQYYNSGSRHNYYVSRVNEINEAANKWQQAYDSWRPYAQYAGQTTKVSCDTGKRDSAGNVITDMCDELTGNAKTEKSLRENIESAKNAYNSTLNRTNTIEDSIETCRSYIKLFNYERDILNEIAICANFNGNNAVYNFDSSAGFSYQDGEYSVGGALIQENATNYSCVGECSGINMKEKSNLLVLNDLYNSTTLAGYVSRIEKRTFQIETNEITYTSSSNYRYINKMTNKYSTYKEGAGFIDIGVRVIPTSYNNPVNDSFGNAIKYKLRISNLAFGENRRFTQNSDYVCEFEFDKDPGGESCFCPQDSDYSGKDLMSHVLNDPISCADAQVKYCYTSSCACPEGTGKAGMDLSSYLDNMSCGTAQQLYCESGNNQDEYCPQPYVTRSITPCLKQGYGRDYCVNKFCNDGIKDKYRCKNTNGLTTGMDITSCVQTKVAQGLTVNQAIDYCDAVVCPIGRFIIYRTIKLENPFPGKDISNVAPGFNNDVRGRFPGTNWNGKLLVYNKIRNNRSSFMATNESLITDNGIGTTVYNTKEPLYRFILTSAKIKEIRDYNASISKGYSDFNLECKRQNSACVSSFVHSKLSGISDTIGTCRNATSKNNFYTCVGR